MGPPKCLKISVQFQSEGCLSLDGIDISAFQPTSETPQGARVKEFPCGESFPFPSAYALGSKISHIVFHFIGHGIALLPVRPSKNKKVPVQAPEDFRGSRGLLDFLRRLGSGLEKMKSQCSAWALMPNRFHLLVRCLEFQLSELMRRIMGSYAGYFNRRHRRAGHLFQNRYKSILCQEEVYFLELGRFIHLYPVRARMVQSTGE
jgi:REP element-mobilizing transposase RayT